MIFTGREKEKKKIIKELEQGKNIILAGKFGIGRTSLAREIAKHSGGRRQFVFVDFTQTPGKMSENLMKQLHICSGLTKTGNKMGYKSMRYRIAAIASSTENKPVVVFDNVAKLTRPKIAFLRYIREEESFQFIAIVENFLTEKHALFLKTLLFPTTHFPLGYLPDKDVLEFVHYYVEKHHLKCSEAEIASLTLLAGGYPLEMARLVKIIINQQQNQ